MKPKNLLTYNLCSTLSFLVGWWVLHVQFVRVMLCPLQEVGWYVLHVQFVRVMYVVYTTRSICCFKNLATRSICCSNNLAKSRAPSHFSLIFLPEWESVIISMTVRCSFIRINKSTSSFIINKFVGLTFLRFGVALWFYL